MLDRTYALNFIIKGIESATKSAGLSVEYPEGVRPPEAPITLNGEKAIVMYRGENGRLRIVNDGDKLSLYIAKSDNDAPDDDMPRVSLSLLDLENYDERDLKYILDEYIESIEKTFMSGSAPSGKKLPTPVSRSKAKSGAMAYDANTLGDRFTKIFPELRDEYRRNIETYDEFLAEDFFVNFGNALVVATIRENDKIKMRKLFNLFNDIYEDGTNDTQSLVAVTIIGVSIAENPELLPNCEEYFSDTMREPVTEIIKYLTGNKAAMLRLQNPPIYKPQKQKKKGLMSSMLGM